MSAKIIKFVDKYVKDIVTDYDALSVRCDEFDMTKKGKELQDITLHLKNTIRANLDMVALSANQIGFDKRIICLNFNGDIRTFVNPIITRVAGFELSRETCHSIPDKTFIRTRYNKIEVTYQTPLGKVESVELLGLAARIFQHHVDHLDGLLLSDIGLEIDADFDNATDEERKEVIDMYLDSLDLTRKQLEEDIKTDKDAQQLADAARFIESVRKGETVIESVPLTEDEIAEIEAMKEEAENSVVESDTKGDE